MFMFYPYQTVRYIFDVQQCEKASSEGTVTLNEDMSHQNYTLYFVCSGCSIFDFDANNACKFQSTYR